MLGKNLHLSQFCNDPAINNINVLGLGPLGDVHIDSILVSWACMGGILAAAALTVPTFKKDGPGNWCQAVAEGYYNFIQGLAKDTIGAKFKPFFPLIAAIFIFVLIGNFAGVGPWKAFEHVQGWPQLLEGEPFELASPTTDFNITAGLALVALVTYLGSGLWAHGIDYVKLWSPVWPGHDSVAGFIRPMFWLEWLDIVVRPSTLALRLMCVITGDELMRAAFLMIIPVLIPTAVMGFELFIGVIQALVFALLTSVYIGLTVAEHH